MKIAISYPPIVNEIGQKAMVSQNRNVQYFSKPTYLLPVVQAQAATMLKKRGYEVIWDDGNSELKSFEEWFDDLIYLKPDLVFFEGTTPVMKFLWDLSSKIKKKLPNTILCLGGYHAMRMPQESLLNSSFDIILKSTNVDFVLLKLCEEIKNNNKKFENLSTTGISYKNLKTKDIVDNGSFKMVENLDASEIVDRNLVKWKNYAFEMEIFTNPGTYASSVIRDCMFGKCTFVQWPRSLFFKNVYNKKCRWIRRLNFNKGVREFWWFCVWYRGKDAIEFSKEIIQEGYIKKTVILVSTQDLNTLMRKQLNG